MPNESSRRQVMATAAAFAGGAGAALIASCGGGGSKNSPVETVSTTAMQNDAAVLATLLDLERSAVVAYETLAAKLSGSALATARLFAAHERAHATALENAIAGLASARPAPKPAAQYRASFPALPDAHAALGFALDVEATAIGAYADALGKVATDAIRARLAAIMATESEHAAALLGRLHRPQVPAAFVTGPPPQQDSG